MTFVLLASSFVNYVMCTLLFLTALFLILLVLVQRGRGGGLTGALGGMGGQSAFGTKAGDMFTKVTMITAGVWIVLCMVTIKLFSSQDPWGGSPTGKAKATAPAKPGKTDTTDGDAASKNAEEPSGGDSKDSAKETGASDKAADDKSPAKTAEQPAAPPKE